MCIERRGSGGFTLVEAIVFLVIVSVGVVAVLATLGPALRGSVEPMRQKQMTAIAESMLNEILHQPFTYCDPDDANAGTAANSAACTNSQDTLGPVPAGESRYGNTAGTQYDNVGDYAGASSANGRLHNPIDDLTGTVAYPGYTAAVAIAQAGAAFGIPAADALQVTVTVTNGSDSFALTGYRFRYAPRY